MVELESKRSSPHIQAHALADMEAKHGAAVINIIESELIQKTTSVYQIKTDFLALALFIVNKHSVSFFPYLALSFVPNATNAPPFDVLFTFIYLFIITGSNT